MSEQNNQIHNQFSTLDTEIAQAHKQIAELKERQRALQAQSLSDAPDGWVVVDSREIIAVSRIAGVDSIGCCLAVDHDGQLLITSRDWYDSLVYHARLAPGEEWWCFTYFRTRGEAETFAQSKVRASAAILADIHACTAQIKRLDSEIKSITFLEVPDPVIRLYFFSVFTGVRGNSAHWEARWENDRRARHKAELERSKQTAWSKRSWLTREFKQSYPDQQT